MQLNNKVIILAISLGIGNLSIFSASDHTSDPIILDEISKVVAIKQSQLSNAAPTSLEISKVVDGVVTKTDITVNSTPNEATTLDQSDTSAVLRGVPAKNVTALDIMSDHLKKVGASTQVVTDQPADHVINIDHNALGNKKEILKLLEQDHEDNVKDLIKYRWCFRKSANFTELFSNIFKYLGLGTTPTAGGCSLVGWQVAANYIIFCGTLCVAAHVICIGWAKCSAREEGEREDQLKSLAETVKFKVTPLKPIIVDSEDGASPPNNSGAANSGSAKV